MSAINTDLTFITNEKGKNLSDRFKALIKDTKFFKVKSLERDAYRSFTDKIEVDHTLGAGKSFFPITLYCMSILDFFSSSYFGYSEIKNDRTRIDQTTRMVEFLCKYLKYDPFISRIAIDIFRHKLVHLGEPFARGKVKGWELASDQAQGYHWTVKAFNLGADKKVYFGVNDFIRDLKSGVLGKNGYYEDLLRDSDLQDRYLSFINEISR